MKAAQLISYGTVEIKNIPEPVIELEKVLVEVHAAGVNPFDWKIRSGAFAKMIPLTLPVTMGGDFSGTVKDPGTSGLKKGDEVYGQGHILAGNSGSFAATLLVNIKNIARKPSKLSYEEAGALPLVGASAVQALIDTMHLARGMRILVHGGAGGIGSIAIQIAKHLGATVATTVATGDVSFVQGLGADLAIDYTADKFEEVLSGKAGSGSAGEDYDAVFDTVGGDVYRQSFKVLSKGGVIVSMLEQPNKELMDEYDVKAISQSTEVTTERLAKLAAFADEGVISVRVDKTFSLDEVGPALNYLESGHPKGKVVIKIK